MKVLCVALLGGLLTTLAWAGDEPKLDARKLVGRWQPVREDGKPSAFVIEFKKDGTLEVTERGKTNRGTWKVKGGKLEVKLGEKKSVTLTVKKLTDKELVTEERSGKTERFVRKK
jgi:uncharacterized protein (TIGR03066 family)